MSATSSPGERERHFGEYSRQFGRILLGDRTGLVIFLGILVWSVAFWRVGFFIRDSVTIANALANVGAGRLAIVETPYALTFGSQPGLVMSGGKVYGRNYGHVLLSLPILWALDGLTLVADLRLIVAAAWSLLVMALGWQLAVLTGCRRIQTVAAVVALAAFVGNSLVIQPLPAERTALMALQVTTMLAVALLGTLLYRLVARFHCRRVGITAGFAVILATPVGFWTSIPKRHVFTALAVVAILYCFAVSRSGTTRRHHLARAGAYVTIGLLTTLHPFEAFFLFLVLVPVDVLTAPVNDRFSLGLTAGLFILSVLPFFVLNTLISGNPLKPPRMLSGVGQDFSLTPDQLDAGRGSTDGGAESTGGSAGNEPTSDARTQRDGSDGGQRGTARKRCLDYSVGLSATLATF